MKSASTVNVIITVASVPAVIDGINVFKLATPADSVQFASAKLKPAGM